MRTFQQGDVLIQAIEMPEGVTKVKRVKGRLILAEGEVTGHAHAIKSKEAELYEKDGVLYLRCETDCTVTHEEHGPVTVPPGDYVVHRVVEVDPFADEVRKVAD